MSEITEKIGHNIRVYRKKKGMTLIELADAVFKSKSTISKYENSPLRYTIFRMSLPLNSFSFGIHPTI